MNRATLLSLVALATLAGCGRSTPTEKNNAPAAAAASAPKAVTSAGLTKRPEFPGFYIDHIGASKDPTAAPVTVPVGGPLVIAGFGFDPIAKAPAKGVDVVIDDRLYPTEYGSSRQDVATATNNPALGATGYIVTVPGEAFTAGPHKILVRVISADGQSYTESPTFPFTAQ